MLVYSSDSFRKVITSYKHVTCFKMHRGKRNQRDIQTHVKRTEKANMFNRWESGSGKFNEYNTNVI